jgi:hypothetical protein
MIDQAHTAASDALAVARLATLTRGDYDRVHTDRPTPYLSNFVVMTGWNSLSRTSSLLPANS